METQVIPGTDLAASRLALGTVPVGSVLGQAESFALLDAYLEGGGNVIDTARVYSDWLPGERSSSEKMIGRWLAERGSAVRGGLILSTKGGHPPLEDVHRGRLSRAEIVGDLEGSLRDLGTEHVDLYWLHRDDETRPVEEIVDTLAGLVKSGQVRYYGASNWTPARIEAANRYARASGQPPFVANQMMWSLAQTNPEGMLDDTLAEMDAPTAQFHRTSGMAAFPYTSQAHGFFGGKYRPGAALPDAPASSNVERLFFNDANFARLERVQQLAQERGLSGSQVALAYLLAQPFPVFPIIGPRTLAQLADSLPAADLELSPDTAHWLDTGLAEAVPRSSA